MRRWLVAIPAGAGALVVLATGCELITRIDHDLIDAGGGATAAPTQEAGTGGATSAAGGGGSGGATATCVSASECPDPGSECTLRTCTKGACGSIPAPAGAPVNQQPTGDCERLVCDGDGGVASIEDPGDPFDDGDPCTADTCVGGTPTHEPALAGTECDGTGSVCDGAGACVECLAQGDCPSGGFCDPSHNCVAPTCSDGAKDGDETDVDCGGGCGPTCATGKACAVPADCAPPNTQCESGVCAP